jgi:hypothetical protein
MKVKVIGERIIVLLGLSREEYGRFQVPFVAEEARTTTARPTTTTARTQEATANTMTTTELAGRFNNRIINFDENPADAIDWGSFDISEFGILKSDEAIRQARHQARSGIVTAIKRAGNTKQQSLVLHMASLHPDVRVCAKTAEFFNNEASNYHWEQMRSILKDASATGPAKGRSTDDESLFVETILTAIASGSGSTEQIPSLVDTSNTIGLSKSTTRRKLKVATAKRNLLVANLDSVLWSRQSKKRKGFSKITTKKRAALCDWV